jgi:hypothetical protein
MLLDVVLNESANEDRLPCQVGLCGDVGLLVEAQLLRFLDQQLATDQFFAHRVLQFRRVRCALCLLLGDEGIGDALRNGDPVDGGHAPAPPAAFSERQSPGTRSARRAAARRPVWRACAFLDFLL